MSSHSHNYSESEGIFYLLSFNHADRSDANSSATMYIVTLDKYRCDDLVRNHPNGLKGAQDAATYSFLGVIRRAKAR